MSDNWQYNTFKAQLRSAKEGRRRLVKSVLARVEA
jgi:hypothetical protein